MNKSLWCFVGGIAVGISICVIVAVIILAWLFKEDYDADCEYDDNHCL